MGAPLCQHTLEAVSFLLGKRFPRLSTAQMSGLAMGQIIEHLHELQDYVASVMIVTVSRVLYVLIPHH